MLLDQIHPEDVRSALRKRWRTMRAFEAEHGLPRGSVPDLLRGRTSQRVREAVEAVLQEGAESIDMDDSAAKRGSHCPSVGSSNRPSERAR